MPEGLWAAATSLAREHGVYRIARALSLNYGSLRERVGETERVAVGGEESGATGLVGFVAAMVLGGERAEGAGGFDMVVEFAAADGAWMTLRLPGAHAVDAVRLVEAFWRRCP